MHTTMDIILEIVLQNLSDTSIALSMLGFAQIEKRRLIASFNAQRRTKPRDERSS